MAILILVATNNLGKLGEFRRLLNDPGLDLVSPGDLGIALDVAESGASYVENARIKAVAYATASGAIAIADDSGIELADLAGWPGIFSVRFAGPGKGDADRRAALLQRLANLDQPTRRARFVCSVVVCHGDTILAEATGTVEGSIASAARGDGGFGYDPIFIPLGDSRTIAEMAPNEKDAISHRARALETIRPFLAQLSTNS